MAELAADVEGAMDDTDGAVADVGGVGDAGSEGAMGSAGVAS